MKKVFTKSSVCFGCYDDNGQKDQDKHLSEEKFTILDVLNADVPLKDKAWFIRKNCELTQDEYRQFAIGCALCVLPIYESKYPGDKSPREAIEAAQMFLSGKITIDVLRDRRRAAYAAAAYADAADAAYAAAAAAYADAADAAYAAAAAAADAAAAYAAAADAAIDYRKLLLQFFIEFTK